MTAMNDDRGMGGRPGDGMPDDGLPDELRRRLADAVSEIRPAHDALDRLREAVPARRRRRRATALTAVATVAVLGIATPMVRTVVITDETTQQSGSKTDSAQDSEAAATGGESGGTQTFSDGRDPVGSTISGGGTTSGSRNTPKAEPSASAPAAAASPGLTLPPDQSTASGQPLPTVPPTTATGTVGPTASPSDPPAPACTIPDLVQVGGNELGTPGADGVTYGVVEVRNVAQHDCTIVGSGHVMVASPPGNPPIQVSVKIHEAGDPASRLPEVPAPVGPLTLRPGASYEFQFAWQPTAGTGVNGSCTPGDNPPGPPPPEPALGYALADGDVTVAEVRLSAACGGVVYRTDVYAAGTHPRVG
ncbi:MAG TPA: hypothetical protein VLH10_15870 [Yinghuangia sp.]|uniref:hypothetical protein n=1 Tax=Yinghuangia sp. YIM S10712 TaxID=3436930 RepID=UPI002B9641E7|nr:hypothetical protein [Yinghuangia sp.]